MGLPRPVMMAPVARNHGSAISSKETDGQQPQQRQHADSVGEESPPRFAAGRRARTAYGHLRPAHLTSRRSSSTRARSSGPCTSRSTESSRWSRRWPTATSSRWPRSATKASSACPLVAGGSLAVRAISQVGGRTLRMDAGTFVDGARASRRLPQPRAAVHPGAVRPDLAGGGVQPAALQRRAPEPLAAHEPRPRRARTPSPSRTSSSDRCSAHAAPP